MNIRNFGAIKDAKQINNLIEIQRKSYEELLQADVMPSKRTSDSMHGIFKEIFPISSYDQSISVDYIYYELGEPRHSPDECRDLKLSYAAPLKLKLRINADEPIEEDVYLCDVPLMVDDGLFIINGAERIIVTQIQRSPGVDFSESTSAGKKRIQSCRIIPERGSWVIIETGAKGDLNAKIDKSSKIPATAFLRAFSDKYETDEQILREFYDVTEVKNDEKAIKGAIGAVIAGDVVDTETGEIVLKVGETITEKNIDVISAIKVSTIPVIKTVEDPLILNTVMRDKAKNRQESLLLIYQKLRPGAPAQEDRAEDFFKERFLDESRYNFGPIGRFRINRKFGKNRDKNQLILDEQDIIDVCKYLVDIRANRGQIDDIDHLANRRIRTIKDLVGDELRRGLYKLKRTVQDRLSTSDPKQITPRTLVNSQAVSVAISYFFSRGELSQVADQSNSLSQLCHERRLSALGPGGLNRKRAGFEVRDVHPSHYGRICPIETPEGSNIGLIVYLSIYASFNEFGFLVTPYQKVKNGKVTDEIEYLMADVEQEYRIAQADVARDKNNKINQKEIIARHKGDYVIIKPEEVDYLDVSTKQLVGIAASLIPFLEHDDANRALMGANMQRQAVPLIKTEAPLVATGVEDRVAANSGMVVKAENNGTVDYVDATTIVVNGIEYALRKNRKLNGTANPCLNQRPIVRVGDKVKAGDIIADGPATANGELALGRNVLVGFLSWQGANFEDAIIVSERLIKDDEFSSVHIEEFEVEIRETKLGKEEITRDIPNVAEDKLKNLDEDGLIRVGTFIKPGDILVGKVAPKTKTELSSEEKLLHAIFGRAGEDVRNDSLEVPPGIEGVIIDVKRFSRKTNLSKKEKEEIKRLTKNLRSNFRKKIRNVVRSKMREVIELTGTSLKNKEDKKKIKFDEDDRDAMTLFENRIDWNHFDISAAEQRKLDSACSHFDKEIARLDREMNRKIDNLMRGDELPTGVLELVKVYVAKKYKLAIGDKLAGRHGNKGVISKVLPEEDMPYLEDGTPLDIILNPLGVPSRMNLGQILETHIGWAASKLNIRVVTPVFDGAAEEEIRDLLREADLPESGNTHIYDGRTGEPLDQKCAVGSMYIMKLHHLVKDKIHARSTGPYSLITQQPLGGKARMGGQRFGEMEVWSLEAYGVANILQELLTVKSDDVEGRTKIYESIIKGDESLRPGTPVSVEVLKNEIKGLGLNLKLHK